MNVDSALIFGDSPIVQDIQNNLLVIAAILGALGVIFTALWKTAKAASNIYQRFMDFFDDWNGVEARPNHDATLGIPARMHNMELRQLAMAEQHENNGGTSLRDAVDRIEHNSQAIQRLLIDHLEDGTDLMNIGVENDKRLYEALEEAGIKVPYHEVQQESLRLTAEALAEARGVGKKLPLDDPKADN